jgi:hypothetical protein
MGGSNRNAECCHSPSDSATVSVRRCGIAWLPLSCVEEKILFTHSSSRGCPVASFLFRPTQPKGLVCSQSACNNTVVS